MNLERSFLWILLVAVAFPATAQSLERGDIVLTGLHFDPVEDFPITNVRVHGRDGVFKRELISVDRRLSEPLYRDGIIYVGSRSPDRIERVDSSGALLSPLTTQATGVNYLSPGPAGGFLATNGSGEIYQIGSNGMLRYKRDFTAATPASGGIEMARSQCTAYYGASGGLARWDVCLHSEPERFGPKLATAYLALRLLPDGTFLVATVGLQPNFDNKIIHVDEAGVLIRTYPIPGNALALDIDGTSFWTNAGNNLFRLDIATGQILSVTVTDSIIQGLSVVGEPRAGLAASGANVPALSLSLCVVLAAALAGAAVLRLAP
jgi:hypothetical protein